MNFHSDEWVMEKMNEHYQDALKHFPEDRIVGLFCQGSTNYGLDTMFSDVDTKLVVVPTFEDVAMNRQPVSTTFIRENDEHIDFKDLRLMLQTFKKQNLNFLEILFTPYKIVNPMYEENWNVLVEHREEIAHLNEYLAVKAMQGMAKEKYHAFKRPYPNKLATLDQYGYDGKQLYHLVRIENCLKHYLAGETYEQCLIPSIEIQEYLIQLKKNVLSLTEAHEVADYTIHHVDEIAYKAFERFDKNSINQNTDNLLNQAQYSIIKKSIQNDLM